MLNNSMVAEAMEIALDSVLPEYPAFEPGVRRAG